MENIIAQGEYKVAEFITKCTVIVWRIFVPAILIFGVFNYIFKHNITRERNWARRSFDAGRISSEECHKAENVFRMWENWILCMIIILIILGIVVAIMTFLHFYIKNAKIVVTNKTVSGYAAFGKRVDLPVDKISAVGIGWISSIVVATSAGKVSFVGLSNQKDVYYAIYTLMSERQKPTVEDKVNSGDTNTQVNYDELIKLKELLDGGIITQDDFETKKKQILGL